MTPPCTVLLRLARLQDAPALAVLSRELIEAGLVWRYTPPRMAALIRHPETVALVACAAPPIQALTQAPTRPPAAPPSAPPSDTTVHGFAVMHFGDAQAHLSLLCVQPQQRQQGIGRRLTDWLAASARVAGITSIALELRADNASALGFYRRLGFVETTLLPGYYDDRIAARRMTLNLAPATP